MMHMKLHPVLITTWNAFSTDRQEQQLQQGQVRSGLWHERRGELDGRTGPLPASTQGDVLAYDWA